MKDLRSANQIAASNGMKLHWKKRKAGLWERPDKPSEEQIQGAVADYLDKALPSDAVWFHPPNGGHRHAAVAAKLKAQGVKPGIPDIVIVWKGRAIFIELKAAKGTLSDAQKAMQTRLTLSGALVFDVARSVDEVAHFLIGVGIPLKVRLS